MRFSLQNTITYVAVYSFFTLFLCFANQKAIAQSPFEKEIENEFKIANELKTKNADSSLSIANGMYIKCLELKYVRGQIKAKALAAFHYYYKQQYDTADLLLTACENYFNDTPREQSTFDHGIVMLFKGMMATSQHQFFLANNHAQKALKIFEQTKALSFAATALNLLGGIEANQSNNNEALDYYTRALKTKLELGEKEENCAVEISNIGAIYLKIGQFDKAIEFARKSYVLAGKIGETHKQINILNTLGAAHSSLQQFDSAGIYYDSCSHLARANNKMDMAYISQMNKANMYFKMSDYRRSIRAVKNILKEPAIGSNVKILGNYLLAQNYLNSMELDRCIQVALPTLKMARRIQNKETQIDLTDVLARAYAKKNKMDSAFYYSLLNLHLNDSLYDADIQRKIGNTYAEIESMDKQQKIELLTRERLIQNARTSRLQLFLASGLTAATGAIVVLFLYLKHREKKQLLVNHQLQEDLKQKKGALEQQALRIFYIIKSLTEVEENLKKIKNDVRDDRDKLTDHLLATVRLNKSLDKEWENFNGYFESVHTTFFTKINSICPDLTHSEKRLVSLIKMDLTNREIASLLNIESSSIKMAKYRLKKKFQLPEEKNIEIFMKSIN